MAASATLFAAMVFAAAAFAAVFSKISFAAAAFKAAAFCSAALPHLTQNRTLGNFLVTLTSRRRNQNIWLRPIGS